MPVSREAVKEYLGRDLDDFRWMKALAREKVEEHVRMLRVRPRFKTAPWLHQLVCFYIALHYPRFLLLLDMGAGKTKVICDVLTQLQREKRARRALVLVPRLANIDSWLDDVALHSDLEPWPVGSEKDTEEKRVRLLNPQGDLTIIDYQGLHLALSKKDGRRLVRDDAAVRRAEKLYDLVNMDEIHKLNALPGARRGGTDTLWFSILRQLTRAVPFAYGCTGTLFGHDVQDLWSPYYLVDRGETFGENPGIMREAFFTKKTDQYRGTVWTFDKAKAPALNRMLQHRSLRYEESELTDLPPRVSRIRALEMTEEQREHYMRALEGLVNAGGQLQECKAQWLRMRQITSGYLAWKDASGDHVVRLKRNPKLEWLETKLDEMGDSKVVVCYDYTETGRMISERVAAMGLGHVWYWGGARDKTAVRERFLTDPACRVMVMNSSAGGTGNDGLQRVARYMVFYESPTPPTDRKQTEKRIHRPGQEQRSFIWDVVMQRTLDAGILASIKEGIDVYDRVVNGRPPPRRFFLAEAPRR